VPQCGIRLRSPLKDKLRAAPSVESAVQGKPAAFLGGGHFHLKAWASPIAHYDNSDKLFLNGFWRWMPFFLGNLGIDEINGRTPLPST